MNIGGRKTQNRLELMTVNKLPDILFTSLMSVIEYNMMINMCFKLLVNNKLWHYFSLVCEF